MYKQIEQFYLSLDPQTKNNLLSALVKNQKHILVKKIQIEHPDLNQSNAKKHVKLMFKVVKNHECGKLFPNNL